MTFYTYTVGDEQKKRWVSYPPQITAALDEARRCIEQGKLSDAHRILDPMLIDGNSEAEYLAAGISRKEEASEDFDSRRMRLLRLAAARDYPPALYALGASLDDTGDGRSRKEAAELFRRAALHGHAHSQWIHGIDLLYGSNGIERNEALGVTFISNSANAGFIGALRTMAEILDDGKFGVARDPNRADHFRSLAQKADVIDY